jgi:hypothetical protein
MGKQTDVMKLFKRAFSEFPIDSIDTYEDLDHPDRLQLVANPTKGCALPSGFSEALSDRVFEVFSGQRQVEKLAEQRFERGDFSPEVVEA